MRIVYTSNDQKKALILSSFLTSKEIENQLDISTETDWGSPNYSDRTCRIWVIDEDQLETAAHWIEIFQKDPNNPIFHEATHKGAPYLIPEAIKDKTTVHKSNKATYSIPTPASQPLGTITLYILLTCCLLFFITEMTEPSFTAFPASLPPTALFSAPIKKKLLYDYPYAFEIIDKLVKLYGIEKLNSPEELPMEGKYLLELYSQTPYWQGFYDKIVHDLQSNRDNADNNNIKGTPQLFEKLRKGEFWRLFTPCLLHSDILHIIFNMIWLIVLGRQIELRLAPLRYILFILITGIFSNTVQYLMSGPNFIGFSGILCAMLTFIWARQKIAAWEGYQLDKTTMTFMMFFILSMFAIQLVSFYFEVAQKTLLSTGIANTAHLSGAALGYVLGRFSFFSWKT